MALFPVFEAPEIVDLAQEEVAEYKDSIYFDLSSGDIVLDSSGKIKMANGQETWLQWCTKMIFTERSECLAYPNGIGVEMEYAMSREDRKSREVAIENTIRETLMNDPSHRTIEVKDFSYDYSADSVIVRFTIVGADGYTGEMSIEIGGE